ncbi:unnamed protein product, partial [marine sediment metagenome]
AWRLPGVDPEGLRCGAFLGNAWACDQGHKWPMMTSCKGWTCYRCAPKVIRQQSMSAHVKLCGLALAKIEGFRLRRSAFSVPVARRDAMMGVRGVPVMKAMRNTVKGIALDLGYLGGLILFHPWRDHGGDHRYDRLGGHFHVTGWAYDLAPGAT